MKTLKTYKTLTVEGIQPYSVNLFKNGKKHSKNYKEWKKLVDEVFEELPDDFISSAPEKIHIGFEIGCAKAFDLDNTLKALIDRFETRYGFNDNKIKTILARKVDVDTDVYPQYFKVYLLEPVEYEDEPPEEYAYRVTVDQNRSNLIKNLAKK